MNHGSPAGALEYLSAAPVDIELSLAGVTQSSPLATCPFSVNYGLCSLLGPPPSPILLPHQMPGALQVTIVG